MPTVITLDELTTGTVDGTGSFDVLMRTAESHILKEYNDGRISSADYSDVYLGVMTAILQTGLQFALAREKTGKEIDLIDSQITRTDQEIQNLIKQNLKTIEETQLVSQQTTNAIAQYQVVVRQEEKVEAEIGLLRQKTYTEEAQISDNANGNQVQGVLRRQMDLYEAQKAGYARDAEQKLAKLMTDSWAVQRSTDEGLQPPNGILADDLTAVMHKAQEGIGVVPT